MKSFIQYITEASRGLVKGWVHKSGKIMDTTMYTRYHIMQVVINLRKFGLNKNKMLKIIRDAYPDAPEEFAEKHLDSLQTGKVDNDTHIEEYLQKRGWCMFVIDTKHASISGWDEKSTKQAAKALDAKHLPFETRKGLKLFEVKLVRGRPKYINSKFDWYNWLEGKKTAGKRTEIGATMAQFREDLLGEAQGRWVCGDCFKWASNWSIEHHDEKHKVVHGIVTNGLGKTFAHAWIEDKGKVYDTNIGDSGNWSIKKFYKAFNAKDTVKYTPTEATRALFKHNHYGPWDSSFDKL